MTVLGGERSSEVAPRSMVAAFGPAVLVWVTSLYFAQGLPYSIVHQVAPLVFVDLGQPPHVQTMTSLYGFAWILKFLWAPLVDKLGTARTWTVVLELALTLALGVLAACVGRGDVTSIALVLVPLSLVAATHDVAIDGFYLRALDDHRQRSLSGLRIGAYRVALIAGKGGLVVFAAWATWRHAMILVAALFLALAIVHVIFLPRVERPAAERPPVVFADAIASYFTTPRIGVFLAFIVLYRAGDVMLFALSPAFLKSLGFTTRDQGLYSGILGALSFITGAAIGAAIVTRRGLARTLLPFTLVQSLAIPIYAVLAWSHPSKPIVTSAMLVEQLAAGFGNASFAVLLMRLCKREYKASHFAIGTALMNVPMAVLGWLSGYLEERTGFLWFFLLAFAASLPAIALTRIVPSDTLDAAPE